mmetsp:Transcript_8949/g.13008  ORF Transcript_8949/g.13008 Transcript_8949/m.13008 type:complete len:211 (-) Transcript_8949:1285-1917(-)
MIHLGILLVLLLFFLLNVTLSYAEIVELTDATFEHETQASTGMTTGSWFVLFKAEQCGVCKKVQPEFKKLSEDEEISEKGYILATVDVPSNRQTSTRFYIEGFPTLYLLHTGKMYKFRGKRTYENFKNFLLESVDLSEGMPIPEPLSELGLFFKEIQAGGRDFYKAALGEHGAIGVVIVVLITVMLVLILGLVSLFFLPSKSEDGDKKKN